MLFSPCLICPDPKVWFSLKLKTARGRHSLWSHDLARLLHIHAFFFFFGSQHKDPILYRQLPTGQSERVASNIPSFAAFSTHVIHFSQHLLGKGLRTR